MNIKLCIKYIKYIIFFSYLIIYNMNQSEITDIFGNKEINNMKPFLLLHCFQPNLILETIYVDIFSIYSPIKSVIEHILYSNNINPEFFNITGDVFISSEIMPSKFTLLLANTKTGIAKNPINYIIEKKLDDIYIWKPISRRDHMELGLVASKEKPSNNYMVTIDREYLIIKEAYGKKMSQNLPNTVTSNNEFNLVNLINNNRITIRRTSFIDSNQRLEIYNKKTMKYINLNTKNEYIMTSDVNNVFYDGRLRINNKCLQATLNNTNNVIQVNCNEGSFWYFYDDTIFLDGTNLCLTDGQILTVQKYDKNNDYQKWNISNKRIVTEDLLQDTHDKWHTIKGRKVILHEPDNPWYVNKSYKPEGIMRPEITNLNDVGYENTAQYSPHFMIDPTSPNVGHGHSYADRNGARYYNQCYLREDFNDDNIQNKNNDIFMLIYCVIIILITFALIKWYSIKKY